MDTIKVKAWAPGQGDFVVINRVDFDPNVHELAEGESLGSVNAGQREPSKAELIAASEALLRRERELDEQALTLADQARANAAEAERLAGLAAANEAEAQRLQSWAASLESQAAHVAVSSTPAPTEQPTEAPAAAPKAGKAAK